MYQLEEVSILYMFNAVIRPAGTDLSLIEFWMFGQSCTWGVLDICLDQSQISFAVFSMKFRGKFFTSEVCRFWDISCVSTCNKVLVTVLFLLIWTANRPGHFLPDSQVTRRHFRHIKYSPLFSDVMLCRAEVSLGKFLDSKSLREALSCRAACSGNICMDQVVRVRKRWKVHVCFLQETRCGSQWPAQVTIMERTHQSTKVQWVIRPILFFTLLLCVLCKMSNNS